SHETLKPLSDHYLDVLFDIGEVAFQNVYEIIEGSDVIQIIEELN
ncbi:17805_t:CDS:1, partial [Gigaspora margarita]